MICSTVPSTLFRLHSVFGLYGTSLSSTFLLATLCLAWNILLPCCCYNVSRIAFSLPRSVALLSTALILLISTDSYVGHLFGKTFRILLERERLECREMMDF